MPNGVYVTESSNTPPRKPTKAPSPEPRSIAQASTTKSTASGRPRTIGKLGPMTDCARAAAASNPAAMTKRRGLFPRVGQNVQVLELIHCHRGLDDRCLERVGIFALDARHFAYHQAFW